MSSPTAAAAASVSAMSASVAEHRASSRAATPSAGTAAAAASAAVAASAGQAPPTANHHHSSTSSSGRPRSEYSVFSSGGPSGLPPAGLRWSSSEMELSNLHRVCSATIGSFLTSLVVTPFDVVKTRLQAQINAVGGSARGAAAAAAATSSSAGAAATPAPRPTASQELLRNCAHFRLHTGLTDQWCANCFSYSRKQPEPALSWRPQVVGRRPPSAEELRFHGALDAAAKLVKYEGLSALWRGLSPTMLMSIPSTVIYFSVYDNTKIAMAALTPEYIASHPGGWAWLAPHTSTLQTFSPLLSGVFARALTTTLVSPIELVRTKSQSLRTSSTMRQLLAEEMRHGGFLSLWRGVGPTLMRDVPFSAIYWSSYEYGKLWMLVRWGVSMDKRTAAAGSSTSFSSAADKDDPHQAASKRHKMIYASFLAGACSGMLSATITHPFDLIKTRRQIELYRLAAVSSAASHSHAAEAAVVSATTAAGNATTAAVSTSTSTVPTSTWAVFKTIVAEEGYIGLLSGLSARITKIAPACAIMISSYEVAKMYFGEANTQQRER